MRLTARAILKVPRTSDYRVLLISRSGKEVTLDSVPDGDENPLIVSVRPPAVDLTDDSWVMAVAATANVVNMIESICGRGQRRRNLAFIDNADATFFPGMELGTFTCTLDRHKELVKQIFSLLANTWLDTTGILCWQRR